MEYGQSSLSVNSDWLPSVYQNSFIYLFLLTLTVQKILPFQNIVKSLQRMPLLRPWTNMSASQYLASSQFFLYRPVPSMPLRGASMLTWLMDILEHPDHDSSWSHICHLWKCHSGPGCYGEGGTLALVLSQWCPLSPGFWIWNSCTCTYWYGGFAPYSLSGLKLFT